MERAAGVPVLVPRAPARFALVGSRRGRKFDAALLSPTQTTASTCRTNLPRRRRLCYLTRKRVPSATAAWRLCSRPTRAESRQREARIGRAWCRTRSTAYSTARAAERLTRCRPSACLQATRCSRRATRVEPPARTAAAASVPRRPPRQRLALPELLYLSSQLSHGFSNRLARDIVVIDVRFAPQLWIAEYAPGYDGRFATSRLRRPRSAGRRPATAGSPGSCGSHRVHSVLRGVAWCGCCDRPGPPSACRLSEPWPVDRVKTMRTLVCLQ